MPSLGEKTPPFQARPVACPRSAASPTAQHVARHAGGLRKITPAGPTGQFGLVVTEIQQPAAMKTRVFTAFGGKSFPEIEALARHRQFASVAVLLPAPAPVAAGLLGADPALLDQGDRNAALGQVVGGKDTDDAAADHDDVSRGRRRGRSLDVVQRRGHDGSRSPVQAWTAWTTKNFATRSLLSHPTAAPWGTKSASPVPIDSTLPSGAAKRTLPASEMHELVLAMRANDPVVGCRIPGARAVLRAVLGEDVVAAAFRGRAQQHLRRQRSGRLEVGVGAQRDNAALRRFVASGRAKRKLHARSGHDAKRGAASDDSTRLRTEHQRGRPGRCQGQLAFRHDDGFDVGEACDFQLTDEAGSARDHRVGSFPRDFAMPRKRVVLAERRPAERG